MQKANSEIVDQENGASSKITAHNTIAPGIA